MSKYGDIVKTDTELKPCPFCGGGIISTHYISTHHKYPSDTVAVCCEICGAGFVKSGENALNDAHTAWNTRAERTCEVLGEDYDELLEYWDTELSCGHVFDGMAKYVNYCPECGAKVVEE